MNAKKGRRQADSNKKDGKSSKDDDKASAAGKEDGKASAGGTSAGGKDDTKDSNDLVSNADTEGDHDNNGAKKFKGGISVG